MKKNENTEEAVPKTTSSADAESAAGDAAAQEEADEILRKYDAETRYRSKLKGAYPYIVKLIAAGMSLFHLFIAGFGTMPVARQRILHLTFAMTLVFLLYPARKKSPKNRFAVPDVVFALMAIAVNLYHFLNTTQIAMRAGRLLQIEVVFGAFCGASARSDARCLGRDCCHCAGFSRVRLFGPNLPGVLRHKGYSSPELWIRCIPVRRNIGILWAFPARTFSCLSCSGLF